ncbi:hypothetical protein ACFWU3_32800 [Streptomyces sp. NPDC058685]|uniref:hypothetical protein n=1 Tax=Streptomyces sp. NPDC058685 TaxID=3346598 RepID=UPI003651B7A1
MSKDVEHSHARWNSFKAHLGKEIAMKAPRRLFATISAATLAALSGIGISTPASFAVETKSDWVAAGQIYKGSHGILCMPTSDDPCSGTLTVTFSTEKNNSRGLPSDAQNATLINYQNGGDASGRGRDICATSGISIVAGKGSQTYACKVFAKQGTAHKFTYNLQSHRRGAGTAVNVHYEYVADSFFSTVSNPETSLKIDLRPSATLRFDTSATTSDGKELQLQIGDTIWTDPSKPVQLWLYLRKISGFSDTLGNIDVTYNGLVASGAGTGIAGTRCTFISNGGAAPTSICERELTASYPASRTNSYVGVAPSVTLKPGYTSGWITVDGYDNYDSAGGKSMTIYIKKKTQSIVS